MATLQVRNVPEDLHQALRDRAAREGVTLSDLIRRDLPRIAHEPSLGEVLDRIAKRPRTSGPSAAELVRQGREERDRQLDDAGG